jgi:hypothetical protein
MNRLAIFFLTIRTFLFLGFVLAACAVVYMNNTQPANLPLGLKSVFYGFGGAQRSALHAKVVIRDKAGLLRGSGPIDGFVRPSDADLATYWQPLSPPLLILLAFSEASSGRMDVADRLASLAGKASRRDLPSQLWLAERCSQTGNVRCALRHYHAMMSVYPKTKPQLLAILVAALSYPEVLKEVLVYIRQGTTWAPDLLNLAANEASLDQLKSLAYAASSSQADSKHRLSNARVLHRLAANGLGGDVFRLAPRLLVPFSSENFWTFGVNEQNIDQRIEGLSWMLPNAVGVSAVFDKGGVEVTARPFSSEVFVYRDLMVQPGRKYVAKFSLTDVGPSDVKWSSDCFKADSLVYLGGGALLKGGGRTGVAVFSVPAGCTLVRLSLIYLEAKGTDSRFEVSPLFLKAS